MKRRNVEIKTRRSNLKNKISSPRLYDGFYTSIIIYIKLILLWICIMGSDYILEFHLEYLYPIYLLLHNSYDTYKFQGIAFTLLLICIIISIDIICLGCIPTHYLYILSILFVWGQIGYNIITFSGLFIIIPTFIYYNTSNDYYKNIIHNISSSTTPPGGGNIIGINKLNINNIMTSSYPLAAHCLGYPLVSIGFGLKTFICNKLKQRTRNDVFKQNEALYTILWDALPFNTTTTINNNEVITGNCTTGTGTGTTGTSPPPPPPAILQQQQQMTGLINNKKTTSTGGGVMSGSGSGSGGIVGQQHHGINRRKSLELLDDMMPISIVGGGGGGSSSTGGGVVSPLQPSSSSSTLMIQCNCINKKTQQHQQQQQQQGSSGGKDGCCYKLECEVKKLRSELHIIKSTEYELKSNINILIGIEKSLRNELGTLQGEHESLLLKYSAIITKNQEDIRNYEKKLYDEKKAKDFALIKCKKVSECNGIDCKRKIREINIEKDIQRHDLKIYEDKLLKIERELQNVKSTLLHEQKNKESCSETTRLLHLLNNIKEQNQHLESSLTAETRLKLDLFSALGEARRQLSIRDTLIKTKEDELESTRGQLINLLNVNEYHQQQQHQHQQQHQQQQQQQQINHHGDTS